MAKAPDPKEIARLRAAEEAARQAEEVRKAREAVVMWVFLGWERRVLRMLDTTALQVRELRRTCGLGLNELWLALYDPGATPLDTLLAAWWLAGMQAGVEGETFEGLLGRSFADAPWLHFPSEEDIAEDAAGDDDPPA